MVAVKCSYMPHLYQNLSYNDNCKYTDRKRAKNAFSYIKYFFLLFIITATASVSIILSNPNTASAVPATALETYETKGYDEQIRTLREEYAAAIVKYAGVVDGTVRPENLAEADNAPEVIEIKKRLDAAEADPAVTLRIDQWSAKIKIQMW